MFGISLLTHVFFENEAKEDYSLRKVCGREVNMSGFPQGRLRVCFSGAEDFRRQREIPKLGDLVMFPFSSHTKGIGSPFICVEVLIFCARLHCGCDPGGGVQNSGRKIEEDSGELLSFDRFWAHSGQSGAQTLLV